MQKINEKYLNLCDRYNVAVRISTINDPDAPKRNVIDDDGVTVITLNTGRIAASDYEMYLVYQICQVLLPRLVLETKRLVLRRFRPEDAADCFDFLSDPKDCYMDCCKPFDTMDEEYQQQMKLFQERDTQYMIVLREENRVIGTVNLFPDESRAVDAKEIGYSISSKYQRKGYAYEALSALINLLQNELNLELLVAGVLEENIASIKLLEKLGFNKEGFRRKAAWHEGLGRAVDLIYYYRDK